MSEKPTRKWVERIAEHRAHMNDTQLEHHRGRPWRYPAPSQEALFIVDSLRWMLSAADALREALPHTDEPTQGVLSFRIEALLASRPWKESSDGE